MKKVKKPITSDTDALYEKAMAEVKARGQKMLAISNAEAVKFRLASGMDEKGHPIKVVETDAVTGEVIKKKRGRKKKSAFVQNAIDEQKKAMTNNEKETFIKTGVKPAKVVKPVKTKKSKNVKKKEKTTPKGRQASAPILQFTEKESSLDAKVKVFDNAMLACFGDKYDTKKLIVDGLTITVTKTLTKPTAKNPKGVLLVQLSTKDMLAKFYEWANKFWMAQLVNFSHYMKPIKK